MDWGIQGEDIQQAINTQTIQTAVEKASSGLSDVALKSFLNSAPIPRAFYNPQTNTNLASGVETTMTFNQSDVVFESHRFYAGSNVFIIPVDGFYHVQSAVEYQQPAGGGTYQQYAGIRSVTGTYGTQYIVLNESVATLLAGSSPVQVMTFSALRPFRAGDTFKIIGFQISSALELETAGSTYGLGICWNAPWNTYVT